MTLTRAWHGKIAGRDPTPYAIVDVAGLSHEKGMELYAIMSPHGYSGAQGFYASARLARRTAG